MKTWKLYLVLITWGVFQACKEEPVNAGQPEKNEKDTVSVQKRDSISTYLIREGNHNPRENKIIPVRGNKLRFKAKFDSSAIYETARPNNQGDINKLYGASDCRGYHQENSARFGWRWYKDQLQILAYCYVNGKRQIELIDTVVFNKFYDYSIEFKENRYVFTLEDKAVEMDRHCSGQVFGYKLLPYFGGDEPAPHDITIQIIDE